jgi:hypothetical protein
MFAGALAFALVVHSHYPIQHWLFFRYARAAALALVFTTSSLFAGHALLVRALGRTLPLAEHLAISLALGVFAFFLTSFAFGSLGLYGTPFFLLAPALLLAAGSRAVLRTWDRLRRHTRKLDLRLHLGLRQAATLLFGLLGWLLLWFPTLSPRNVSFDAAWFHLPIAEHYVAQGGIAPFSEGWVLGAVPQLASLLYAWPFSMPGTVFDRVVTAAQLEVAIFSMTLVGVTAITRRVLGRRAPLSWAALFLFPGIFCYDSGLLLGADHVAALFAAPLYLLSLRYLEQPSRAHALLLAAFGAAILDTKYSAVILIPLLIAVVVARLLRDARQQPLREALLPPCTLLAALLVLTAPHWLKNAIYYGDPLFPVLRAWLPARPWSEAAEAPYRTWFNLKHAPATLAGAYQAAKSLVTFAFVPNDFPGYHGTVPVFGALFTLCTPALLFLRHRPRLLWLFGGTYLGLAVWPWIHQYDRYLQVLLPWMAAGTAAVLSLLWREGFVLRAAVCSLVGLQVVWGGDVAFIPSHLAAGSVVHKLVIDLLGRGYQGDYAARLVAYPQWEAMGRQLPPRSKVLVHEGDIRLGLGARSALDYSGDQGAFYWGEPGARSPREVWQTLRSHGITHLIWFKQTDRGSDSVAAGLVFFEFARRSTRSMGTYGPYELAALSDTPPAASSPGDVAYYPCEPEPPFVPGLYRLGDLARAPGDARHVARPAPEVSMQQAIERASFLVFDERCHGALEDATRARFELLATRGKAKLFALRSAP